MAFNNRFKTALLSISDWPLVLGKDLYNLMNECLDDHFSTERKINALLTMYEPYQIIYNNTLLKHILWGMNIDDLLLLSKKIGIDANGENVHQLMNQIKLNKKNKQIIIDFFDIDLPTDEGKIPVAKNPICTPIKCLRNYQQEVLSDTLYVLKNSNRCLVHMPTGAGKTTTAMEIIARSINDHNGPAYIIWLAYSHELCNQAEESFRSTWVHKGNRPIKIVSLHQDTSLSKLPTPGEDVIVICTLAKLNKIWDNNPLSLSALSKYISIVVFDEAHQSVAPVYSKLINQLTTNRNVKLLGLTATPGRSYNNNEDNQLLADFYYKNKVGIKVEGKSPMQLLTEEGYLSSIEWYQMPAFDSEIQLSTKEIHLLEKIRNTDEDIPQSIINKIGHSTKRNLKILSCVDDFARKGMKRIVIFASSVEHARSLSALFSACGYDSGYIDSTTDMKHRNKLIDDFKNINIKTLKILCNFNILSTGVDIPNIDSAIIARPLTSVVLFSQMVGRVIRGPKTENGTEKALIATIVDTEIPGFKDNYELWTKEWDKQ